MDNYRTGASQVALVIKNLPTNAGDLRVAGLIPMSGRSPGGEHGDPLQYSCLEKPMDRGAWWATIHMAVQSDTTEVIQHACMYNITFYLLNNLSIYLSIYIYISYFLYPFIY